MYVDGRWRAIVDGVAVRGAFESRASAAAFLAEAAEQAAAEQAAAEQARQAGMEFGVAGFNDVMGWGDWNPGPCGHHCRDCPRCGY